MGKDPARASGYQSTDAYVRSKKLGRLYVKACAAHDAGDVDAAIGFYEQVLDADPRDAGACCNLGNIYSQRRDAEPAKRLLRAGLMSAPKNAMLHVNLGGALSNLDRDYKGAVACFEAALKCPSINADELCLAHGNMGITYMQWCTTNEMGGVSYSYDTARLDKAIYHLKTSTKFNPHGSSVVGDTHRRELARCMGWKADLASEKEVDLIDEAIGNMFGGEQGGFGSWAEYTAPGWSSAFKQTTCSTCGAATKTTCGGCSIALFCSRACQAEGWKVHKGVCKRAVELPTFRSIKVLAEGSPMRIVETMLGPHAKHAGVADACMEQLAACITEPYPEDDLDVGEAKKAVARVGKLFPRNPILQARVAVVGKLLDGEAKGMSRFELSWKLYEEAHAEAMKKAATQ